MTETTERESPVGPQRHEALLALGFSSKALGKLGKHQPGLISAETARERLSALETRGFADPVGLFERAPTMLGLLSETIHDKLDNLQQAGFENPVRLVERQPVILGLAAESIQTKLADLTDQGFEDPIRLIERQPVLICLASEGIRDKITNLERLGFDRAVALAENQPLVLGMAQETVRTKLAVLREQGFREPVRLVERAPMLLGLASRRVERRIRQADRLIRQYRLEWSAVDLFERYPSLFSFKEDKLMTTVRVFRDIGQAPTGTEFFRAANLNLETVVLASEAQPTSVAKLFEAVQDIKRDGFSQEEKRQRILASAGIRPKIKRRYLRGYPLRPGEEVRF